MFGLNISILSIFAIVPVLGFLIFIHELGHFLAARWMGVRVLEFGFGYPPRMIKLFERNGVEYTLNWLPFGGFVRMAGEDGDEDDPHALPNVAPWRRIVVMAAGPFMNLVTAAVIFSVMFMANIPLPVAATMTLPVQINGVLPDTPAASAGFKSGDLIVAINGEELLGTENVKSVISKNPGQEIVVTIKRNGQLLDIPVTPKSTESGGMLGVQISERTTTFWQSIMAGFLVTWNTIVLMIGGLVQLIRGLISPDVPKPEGGVGGLIAIGRITADVARQGFAQLMNLTALLSINLAILNLLPIPALDGGRIVFALAEMISRKRIPPEKEALIHMAGFVILIGFMVLITFMDISNWIAGKPPIPGG